MKIAIDANRAVIENAGIGRYAFEIIKNIIEIDKKNEYLLIFTHFRSDDTKEKKIKELTHNGRIKSIHFPIPGGMKEFFWGQRLTLFNFLLKDCDIFFAPSFFEVNLGFKIPQVVTIHDLTTFIYPKQRGEEVSNRLNKRTKLTVEKAKKVICISQSTKNDLLKFTGISPDKTATVYLASTGFKEIAPLPKILEDKKYILTVGTIEPRKNLIGLFRAFAKLDESIRRKFPLVIAGGHGWQTSPIFAEVEKLKIKNDVIFLGHLPDSTLGALYKNAYFFAYPSLYEGFGLPVLEALKFGKAVLTSNVSSLPEVAGSAALLVNPNSEQEIATGLERLIKDDKLRSKFEKEALRQEKKFSWQKCAAQTLKILENANG